MEEIQPPFEIKMGKVGEKKESCCSNANEKKAQSSGKICKHPETVFAYHIFFASPVLDSIPECFYSLVLVTK